MQGAEKTRIIYLNDTAIVTVKRRSVNMMDGWEIKTLQKRETWFHQKFINFKQFLMMDPEILNKFFPEGSWTQSQNNKRKISNMFMIRTDIKEHMKRQGIKTVLLS